MSSPFSLDGATCLVTAANRGIGAALTPHIVIAARRARHKMHRHGYER